MNITASEIPLFWQGDNMFSLFEVHKIVFTLNACNLMLTAFPLAIILLF